MGCWVNSFHVCLISCITKTVFKQSRCSQILNYTTWSLLYSTHSLLCNFSKSWDHLTAQLNYLLLYSLKILFPFLLMHRLLWQTRCCNQINPPNLIFRINYLQIGDIFVHDKKAGIVALTKMQKPPAPHWPQWSPECSTGLWSRIQDEAAGQGPPSKQRHYCYVSWFFIHLILLYAVLFDM